MSLRGLNSLLTCDAVGGKSPAVPGFQVWGDTECVLENRLRRIGSAILTILNPHGILNLGGSDTRDSNLL